MQQKYSQTELWMSYGILAGLVVGVLTQVATGSALWIGPSFILGLVAGMAVGQLRDKRSSG